MYVRNRKQTRKWLLVTLAFAGAAMLAVGCGSDDDDGSDANGEAAVNAENWTLAAAAEPYAGTEIRVLDEVTDLQPSMAELIPQFEEETGINVTYDLEGHFDVIRRGEADLIQGRGYDVVMAHMQQLGRLLEADAVNFIDEFLDDPALKDPSIDFDDFLQPSTDLATLYEGQRIGFPNWYYNTVWWGRSDLMEHPDEQAAFEEEYGYELAPPETIQEMFDIAEFFDREEGDTLAGETLDSDLAGFVMEGSQEGAAAEVVEDIFMKQFGGGVWDEDGNPALNRPENVEAMELYREFWDHAPDGQAEMSLIDIPVVMGEGRAASGLVWSDFTFSLDQQGQSPHAGNFVYAGSPANAENEDERHALALHSGLVLNQGSENKEAAFLFMQWMVSKQIQSQWMETGTALPVREDSYEILNLNERGGFYAATQESQRNGSQRQFMPQLYEMYDAINRMQQTVGRGDAEPEAALESLQSELEDICGGESCALPGEQG